jgi:mRNA interferase RelE/StbE
VASALKEWKKLAPNIRDQFRKKLAERLRHPHVPSAKLSQMPNCYKIKLRAVGYRLVYQVEEHRLVVVVIAVGRRDREEIYKAAVGRIA